MLIAVVVVPELRGDEDVLALDEALFDSSTDALACLLLVTIVVRTIKQPVTGLDCLKIVSTSLRTCSIWQTHVKHRVGGLIGRHFPETEANKRHFMAGGQLHCSLCHNVRCGCAEVVERGISDLLYKV